MILNRRQTMLGLAASSLGLLGQSARASTKSLDGHAFGSTWRVVTDDTAHAHLIRWRIEDIVSQIDREMSPYRASSALSEFNALQTTDGQAMPDALCAVTTTALDIAKRTGGAFDPTVGPLVGRYGFGPIEGECGHYTDISVSGNAITKQSPGLTLDLCGIAKGYALDQMVDELTGIGTSSALIELGGEVKTIGLHPDGRPWRVVIADPNAKDFKVQRVIMPGQNALATSGHAENGVTGPIETSHIINPHAERSAATALASVSVLAARATEADAYATALCAAGTAAGVEMAKALNISALFVTDGSAHPREITTGSFANHILI